MTSLLILNGPNLNLLGTRQPEIYGHVTLKDIEKLCQDKAIASNIQIQFEQNTAEVFWNDKGMPYTKVVEADYTFYTKNEDENRKLQLINNFITALDGLESLVAIQKVRFMQISSGLLYVDMATGKLKINKQMFTAL